MRAYSIFDDFPQDAVEVLEQAGVKTTVHPLGVPRPAGQDLKKILEEHDCIFIGTGQKISEDMFEKIDTPRVIATASVGTDHIRIPEEKRSLVTVFTTPHANARSVVEFTMACALTCCKRIAEGRKLYLQGKDNKKLSKKPEDLDGKKLGVVGAGYISGLIMKYAQFFGMTVSCYTAHPDAHPEIREMGVDFKQLDQLLADSDVISVNLPNVPGTEGLISGDKVDRMKENSIFISVSRRELVDYPALFKKAKEYSSFYVCLDLDVDQDIADSIPDIPNIIVTPHIAGGTIESRLRMFRECARKVAGHAVDRGTM